VVLLPTFKDVFDMTLIAWGLGLRGATLGLLIYVLDVR
jgi:hypothetical protein